MEFDTTVFTIVVPLICDPADFMQAVRIHKADMQNTDGFPIWTSEKNQVSDFLRCFNPRPLSRTFQLEDSPFMKTGKDAVVARFDLSQSQRGQIGIHHNQNCTYLLMKGNIRFQIKQVRLWMFRWGTAFLTIEIFRNKLSDKEVLDLAAQLCAVQLKTPISYKLAVQKDTVVAKSFTMRELIEKVLDLQHYVKFQPYRNETFKKAWCLFFGIGDLQKEDGQAVFLEMLRMQRKSCMRSGTGVACENIYRPFSYIHWVTGEKMLAVVGDLSQADTQSASFLRDKGGLRKTVSENYLLLYLHYLSVHLYARRMMKECEDIESGISVKNGQKIIQQLITLSRIPVKDLSTEAHINTLFERYLCEQTWKLQDYLERLGRYYLPALIKNRPCDIFISYRRKGGFYPARLLYTLLEQKQKKTFLDMESLGVGRFDEHIYEVMERCRVVLVVLTEDCLARCADEDDWMRKEVAKAMERKKLGQLKIIPVMIDDFAFPKKLPEEIDISRENAVRFTPQSFRGDFEMLCRFIEEL